MPDLNASRIPAPDRLETELSTVRRVAANLPDETDRQTLERYIIELEEELGHARWRARTVAA